MILISNLLEDFERVMTINMISGKRINRGTCEALLQIEEILQREVEAAEVTESFQNRSSSREEKLKGAKVHLHTEKQDKK